MTEVKKVKIFGGIIAGLYASVLIIAGLLGKLTVAYIGISGVVIGVVGCYSAYVMYKDKFPKNK